MAREPTRTDNEFRNRQPAKIRRAAKLTAAPGHADNCGLRFNPGAIITKRNPLTVRAHVSFVRSQGKQRTGPRTIFVFGGKKYSEFTASFEVNQSARSCSRVFVPDAACRGFIYDRRMEYAAFRGRFTFAIGVVHVVRL